MTSPSNTDVFVVLQTMRELHEEHVNTREHGEMDRVAWTNDGRILSVSTQSGCFLAYRVLAGGSKARQTAQATTVLSVALEPIAPSDLGVAVGAALLGVACLVVGALARRLLNRRTSGNSVSLININM